MGKFIKRHWLDILIILFIGVNLNIVRVNGIDYIFNNIEEFITLNIFMVLLVIMFFVIRAETTNY